MFRNHREMQTIKAGAGVEGLMKQVGSFFLIFGHTPCHGLPGDASSIEPTCQPNLQEVQEMWVRSLGQEDPLE